jgi:hypothetical protein
VDRVCDLGWVVVQRQSTMHSRFLHEGESVERKTQRRLGREFWPRQDICKAKRSILLSRDVVGSQEVCQ